MARVRQRTDAISCVRHSSSIPGLAGLITFGLKLARPPLDPLIALPDCEHGRMNSSPSVSRVLMLAAAGVAVVLLIAVLCTLAFVDINDYKPRVEASLSQASGANVTIEGSMSVAFTPMLGVSLEGVRVINQGIELAFVKRADVALELLPLIWGEIRYGTISANGTRVAIVRDRDGRYNYQRPNSANQTNRVLMLPKVNFSELIVTYLDQQSNDRFESMGCDGVLTGILHPGGSPLLQHLSMRGNFECAEVRNSTSTVGKLKFVVTATDGVYDFTPVTLQAFGGTGAATMHMDRTGESPTYKISITLSKFHIEQFFKNLKSGLAVSGLMDFSTTLAMRGRTRLEMRQTAVGEMSLSGTDLTLTGMDLDAQLVKFESSQNLNLIDVSALLFAGPVGLVVTKGADFAGIAQTNSGKTALRTVISTWKVENGIASAKDVALATTRNRVAVHGGLDFATNQYRDITVGLLDSNGCTVARQKISGPFSKPVADKSNILVPIGPFLKLLDKAKTLFAGPGTKCEVFYQGTVPQPA